MCVCVFVCVLARLFVWLAVCLICCLVNCSFVCSFVCLFERGFDCLRVGLCARLKRSLCACVLVCLFAGLCLFVC